MRALFLAAIAALSSSALAQHYGPKDKISENDIDKRKSRHAESMPEYRSDLGGGGVPQSDWSLGE